MFEIDTVFFAVAGFLGLFCVQIILSRFVRGWSEDRFVLSLYVGLPAVGFLCYWALGFPGVTTPDKAWSIFLLFFAISSAWVASYPAIYAVCPTLVIALIIRHRKSGTTLDEIKSRLNLKKNSVDRIDDALNDNLIFVENSAAKLSTTGFIVARFFLGYRRLLGLRSETL